MYTIIGTQTKIYIQENGICNGVRYYRYNCHYITMNIKCQEHLHVLKDVAKNGKIRKWAEYKMSNTYLSYAYRDVDLKKSERLTNCASFLQYKRVKNEKRLKLVNANFCRVRLCPVCSWRRSLKIYGQMSQIVSALQNQYSYIFITLTVKNCNANDLSNNITWLTKSFNYMTRNIDYKRSVHGYYRAIEITRNRTTGEYHPHIHALLAVKRAYFNSRYYISRDSWQKLWTNALCTTAPDLGTYVDYEPIIDVRRVRPKSDKNNSVLDTTGIMSAIAEVAKYAVKSADIICFDDWDLTVDTVRTLDTALAGRRLATMGGCFKQMHKQLHLSDLDDDSDLLAAGVSDDIIDDDDSILYVWHSGYSEYIKSD